MKWLFLFLATACFQTLSAQNITGAWKGAINIGGNELPIVIHLKQNTSGTITGSWDSPAQHVTNLQFSKMEANGNELILEMEQFNAQYKGTFVNDDSLSGNWVQNGQSFPLHLKRSDEQTVFYPNEKELTLKMRDGYKISGTLLAKDKKQPLVLIIAGSGPTDRNGNNPMASVDAYRMLAHNLDSQNIATFRFDKRGVAGSLLTGFKEDDLLFKTYIDDAEDIVTQLYEMGFKNIVIAGHSEGSLIGMVAAVDKKVQGYISIAGAGRSIDKILSEQLSKGVADSVKTKLDLIISSLRNGEEIKDIPAGWQMVFRPSVQPYLISWMKYNPLVEIKKLNCPVLIIAGTCDIQVPECDAKLLADAFPKSKLVIIKNMSHTLKNAGDDCKLQQSTYSSATMPLDKELTEVIATFVKKVAG